MNSPALTKILIMTVLTVSLIKGQTNNKIKYEYYGKELSLRDSLYDSDTIYLRYTYFPHMDKNGKRNIDTSNYIPIIASIGEMVKLGTIYWSQYGLWKYFYENGKLAEETFSPIKQPIKYINQWFPNGEQILKDGNGIYYHVDDINNPLFDSTVYEIKTGMRDGKFERWLSDNGRKDYYLWEEGEYKNNIEISRRRVKKHRIKTTK
jgi:hypothetical protein